MQDPSKASLRKTKNHMLSKVVPQTKFTILQAQVAYIQFNIDRNALHKPLNENQFTYRSAKISKELKDEDNKKRGNFTSKYMKST